MEEGKANVVFCSWAGLVYKVHVDEGEGVLGVVDLGHVVGVGWDMEDGTLVGA